MVMKKKKWEAAFLLIELLILYALIPQQVQTNNGITARLQRAIRR